MSEGEERVLSVFELAQGLKRIVEDATAGCWVEGEIGRLQCPVSGHVYFTLKDETRDATIDCVMYKREVFRYRGMLSEGARVQLKGRASFYPPRGRLQWIAEAARPAGQGALLEAILKIRQRLVEEGLTDPARKRPLPSDPRTIGVVTSRTGAAFSDICSVAQRRGPVRLLLSPAVVQGDGAVSSLMKAFDLLERARPDVIIVGRGGGSAEDLMAFNDEALVRRIAASSIVVVSAVGHEIDTSLLDLVADVRAATPSQAAELVVPDQNERVQMLRRETRHLCQVTRVRLARAGSDLGQKRRKLADPRFLVAEGQQALDELRIQLSRRSHHLLSSSRLALSGQRHRLYARHPRAVVASARTSLGPLTVRNVLAMRRVLAEGVSRLSAAGRSLSALSPLSVLGRGYALATRPDGALIRDASLLRPGETLKIRVEKGSFSAQVEKVDSSVENLAVFEHESPAGGGDRGDSSV